MTTDEGSTGDLNPVLGADADNLFRAVERGDLETVRSHYDPEIRVWHNWDDHEQDVEENLQTLGFISASWSPRFEGIRRTPIDGGYIQQHTLVGTNPETGESFAAPAIMKVELKGRKVARIEEYFDKGQVPPF